MAKLYPERYDAGAITAEIPVRRLTHTEDHPRIPTTPPGGAPGRSRSGRSRRTARRPNAATTTIGAPVSSPDPIIAVTPRRAVDLFVVGFGLAGLGLAVAPRRTASTMAWGYGSGWQREIAIWNAGTLVTIFAVRRSGLDGERSLLKGYATLAALFALNHLASAVKEPKRWGHWSTAGMNLIGVAAAATALRARRPDDIPS
jgi:hypothetical protein